MRENPKPVKQRDGGADPNKFNPTEAARRMIPIPPSESDPLGSWTGRPRDPDERPVQDSDDL